MMDLTDYVIMPGENYKAACDAVRAKTGKAEGIKSGELAGEIREAARAAAAQIVTRSVTELRDEKIEKIGSYALARCYSLEKAVLPKVESIESNAFYQCTALRIVDIASYGFDVGFFSGCTALEAVILREHQVLSLAGFQNWMAANDTSINKVFACGTGNAWFYIPAEVYDEQMEALPNFGSRLFRKIEDYPEITGV